MRGEAAQDFNSVIEGAHGLARALQPVSEYGTEFLILRLGSAIVNGGCAAFLNNPRSKFAQMTKDWWFLRRDPVRGMGADGMALPSGWAMRTMKCPRRMGF
jgi:hypothetical protein